MTETFEQTPASDENPKEQKEVEELGASIIDLAKELIESQENFSFPGIDSDAYQKIKAVDDEFSGLTTHIDEIIKRAEKEGIKVVLGEGSGSSNVFILPSGSDDVENDCISPRHLRIDETMDDRLKELILKGRESKALYLQRKNP